MTALTAWSARRNHYRVTLIWVALIVGEALTVAHPLYWMRF